MKLARFYSPRSPQEPDEMSVAQVQLERKERFLPQLKGWYDRAIQEYQDQLIKHEMADNRNRSIRRKRKLECGGCSMKQCTKCNFDAAYKKMRDYGAYIIEVESEIQGLKSRIESEQNSPPPMPPADFHHEAINDSNEENVLNEENDSNEDDSTNEEIKQEDDIKQEPEDSYLSIQFQFSIGIVNNIKSEPMDRSNEDESTDHSEDESSDESTDESVPNESTIPSEQSFRDYPTTPERSDYTTDSEDSNTDTEDDDENEDRRPKSILDLLKYL